MRQAVGGGVSIDRVRAVDAFRAAALCLVILGHWLAFALFIEDGQLMGRNVQQVWPPGNWLTWVFQVMPVFFLVGGYGNAASWTRRRERATTLAWVGARVWRLLLPTSVLVAAVVAGTVILRLVGVDGHLVDLMATQIAIPLWFLAVYLVVVPLTPVLVAAVDRRGLAVPAGLLGAALVADLLFVHLGVPAVGYLNYAFFWIGIYALGVTWRHGDLSRRRPIPLLLVAGGLTAALLLVWLGPYPVSMLAAQGEAVQNNGPPSAALVCLALAQTGVVLMLQPRVEAWCSRPRVWTVVGLVNIHAMTLYLWHMVAGVLAALVFYAAGLVERVVPPSPEWWLWRPAWYAICVPILLVLVMVFGRFERRVVAPDPGPPMSRTRGTAVALGVTLAAAGMLQLAINGLADGPAGVPLLGLLGFGVGSVLVAWASGIGTPMRAPRRDSARPGSGDRAQRPA
jgi:hypothetical protein